jgi:hypothetical protein
VDTVLGRTLVDFGSEEEDDSRMGIEVMVMRVEVTEV